MNEQNETPEHVHDWKPIPLEWNRYMCECGVTGYRNLREGCVITPHKQPLRAPGNKKISTGGTLGHHRHGKRGPGEW